MTNKTTATNISAQETFASRVAEIQALLARLQGAADDHFGVEPDDVHWGHAGDLGSYIETLRDLTDRVFNEAK